MSILPVVSVWAFQYTLFNPLVFIVIVWGVAEENTIEPSVGAFCLVIPATKVNEPASVNCLASSYTCKSSMCYYTCPVHVLYMFHRYLLLLLFCPSKVASSFTKIYIIQSCRNTFSNWPPLVKDQRASLDRQFLLPKIKFFAVVVLSVKFPVTTTLILLTAVFAPVELIDFCYWHQFEFVGLQN
jgi:hypothetical protein